MLRLFGALGMVTMHPPHSHHNSAPFASLFSFECKPIPIGAIVLFATLDFYG